MLQLQCIDVNESEDESMALVRFALLLNGEPTNQFVVFSLQPDFCEVGDLYSLTADDFVDRSSTLLAEFSSLN